MVVMDKLRPQTKMLFAKVRISKQPSQRLQRHAATATLSRKTPVQQHRGMKHSALGSRPVSQSGGVAKLRG